MALGSAAGSAVDPDLTALGIISPNLNAFNALLGAASAAIAVGLVQQALAIRQQAANWPSGLALHRTGAHWEAALRCALSATIVGCMTIQLLNMRQFLTFPEDDMFFYGDVVTQYLWWLTILIALADASRRVIGDEPRPRRWLISGVIWFGLLGLATYIVTDLAFIGYLVHLACRGVDAAQPLEYQRYPVMTLAAEWSLVLTTAGAATAVVTAAVLILRQFAKHGLSSLRCPRKLVTLAFLLATSGTVCFWYYASSRHWLSPDWEGIGFGSSWWQQRGGIAMAAVLVTYAIYRCWHASATSATPDNSRVLLALPLAGEQFFALFILAATAALYTGQNIWAALAESFFSAPLDGLLYLAITPSTCFIVAMLVLSLQLIRLRWKGRAPAPLVVVPLRSNDFILAWLALAAIVIVAIPTFAAFGFAYWLGPWYRW